MKPSHKNQCLLTFLAIGLSCFFVISCDHTNSRKMTPPELRDQSGRAEGEITELKISNAVDILFVIDNSESMGVHQQNLSRNIDRLVRAIEDNNTLDYHIGIVPVFDSRYGTEIPNFNPNGHLLPLKGDTRGLPTHYYTREHNDIGLLSRSLLIGVLPLRDKNGNYQGPEHEQIFSPILSTFSEPALSAISNQSFYRPDARLAIIIITDADDSSTNISYRQLNEELRRLKQSSDGSKISTFGLLAATDKKNGCAKVDPGMIDGKPTKIINFLIESQGQQFSLCRGDFPNMLAEIGKTIQEKTEKQKIQLQDIPELGTIKVFVTADDYYEATQVCDPNDKVCQDNQKKKTELQDWSYDPLHNQIVINSIPSDTPKENKLIKVQYTKVYMTNVRNGRAQRY